MNVGGVNGISRSEDATEKSALCFFDEEPYPRFEYETDTSELGTNQGHIEEFEHCQALQRCRSRKEWNDVGTHDGPAGGSALPWYSLHRDSPVGAAYALTRWRSD